MAMSRARWALEVAWDFFLSFVIRFIFTGALVGGADWLYWCFEARRTHWWNEDEANMQRLVFVLAGVTTLLGLIGTFRRGKAEKGFSVTALASIAGGAAAGHVAAPHMAGRGRTLMRFPVFESFILGGGLVGLWLAVWMLRAENVYLRIGAIVGGVQIAWGVGLMVLGRRKSKAVALRADGFG